MRIIKFKARREDNGQWITGDLLQHIDGSVLIGDNIGPWDDDGYSLCDYHKVYHVDPATVGQFTGFYDKNDKEVYEGDVLRSDLYPYSNLRNGRRDNYFGIVFYSEEEASFHIMVAKNSESIVIGACSGESYHITQKKLNDFEVVGNIHEEEWKQYGEYFQDKEEKEAEDDKTRRP